ncbi:MAG: metal ABC transporter permease [Planctomycetes bacterium]|nr:metal ABC transporter permease [Planctomycetota bacterium]
MNQAYAILADRISSDTTLLDQLATFFAFEHLTLIYGAIGAVLLGTSCGLLGCFVVLRKMSLLGDSIGHAVLPGICVAFLITQTKSTPTIFLGAVVAGVLATLFISGVTRFSRIKPDTAIGLALSGFFGLGIVLLTRIQRMSFGDQSGLDKYMFGDAAAIGIDDLRLMAAVTVAAILTMILFYRQFLVTAFDETFAATIGIPIRFVQLVLMTLLALAIVTALQAVGVVLVSAMLITPAATAYLLTDRLPWMLVLAAVIGSLSGFCGLFISFMLNGIPTGPCMVLTAAALFTLAFLFSPTHGALIRALGRVRRRRRVQRENLLKTVFALLDNGDSSKALSLSTIAEERGESIAYIGRIAKSLASVGLGTLNPEGLVLTPAGSERAAQVVRNHRLWELYLTQEASVAPDHVHRDAEEIEHVLGEELVRKLQEMLDHPDHDPHGRRIPQGRAEHPAQEAGFDA